MISIPNLCLLLYFWLRHLELLLTGCVFYEYYIRLRDLLILISKLFNTSNVHFEGCIHLKNDCNALAFVTRRLIV